jgi:ERCC4-type nuclease
MNQREKQAKKTVKTWQKNKSVAVHVLKRLYGYTEQEAERVYYRYMTPTQRQIKGTADKLIDGGVIC